MGKKKASRKKAVAAVSLDALKAKLPQQEQEHIALLSERLIAEELTLQALRKQAGATQQQIADWLGVKQVSVSGIEKRSDLLVSTLEKYIRGMGGTLHMIVQLPDLPPVRLGLGSKPRKNNASGRTKRDATTKNR